MPISKQEQIQQRRTRVWELYSRGLTQEKIADELEKYHVSRRTIGYDLEYLKKDSANFVTEHRKRIAEEYAKIMSNLEQLRREAWEQFSEIKKKDNDSNIKVSLYNIIQSINNNILDVLSVGDMIEMEMKVKAVNSDAKEIREEMSKAFGQRIRSNQAIF